MMKNKTFSTKGIALNGILIALAVIALYLESILPVNKLSLYALSSFFVAVILLEYGLKNAWAFYAASTLLSFILLPDKAGVVPYAVFFGLYGIIKYYVEQLPSRVPEYLLKLVYFNACVALAVFFMKQYFVKDFELSFPWWGIAVALQLLFVVYDYVYTLFVRYYCMKLKKILRI